MSTLVLYYSHSGNTKKLAEYISQMTGADISEINPRVTYPGEHNMMTDKGRQEIEQGFEPEIKALSIKLDDYDTIFLGTPVWMHTISSPVKSILSATSWSGKSVYPFATHNGWLGHTFEDFESALALTGAKVEQGFDTASLITSKKDIKWWLKETGLLLKE